ncbi:MAG: GNAT family N-acetyltransferase [Acidimicrobiales bacterium]
MSDGTAAGTERPTGDPDVVDRPAEHRYVVRAGHAVAGAAEYRRRGERVVFTHTLVDPAYEGRGLGSRLVQAALDDVRGQGATVVPICPFVAAWIRDHPGYADLVDERSRHLLAGDTPTAYTS